MKDAKFELKPSVANKIVDENGNMFSSVRALARHLGTNKTVILASLRKKGYFSYDGVKYIALNTKPISEEQKPVVIVEERKDEKEYQEFMKAKEVQNQSFEVYDIKPKNVHTNGFRYAVALFSDAHIEETVLPESVLGQNEYNLEIAEERIKNYFRSLANCINEDRVNQLIFASLGDTISGYIHDELAQCNGLSPLEATYKAQSLIYSGLKFLCENTQLENIQFIGIVGNHSRTTKKIQHANGYRLSYEWLMYKNVEDNCKEDTLPIDFCIPESELTLVNAPDGQKFIFCHGFQIKGSGNGTVCGIYPALNRLSMKWGRTFQQDKIFLGHFHSITSIPNAVVNGSIIGYNTFSLTNGFPCERPMQYYVVYDSEIGELLERKIYCD